MNSDYCSREKEEERNERREEGKGDCRRQEIIHARAFKVPVAAGSSTTVPVAHRR